MTTNASKSVVSVFLSGSETCPAFGVLEIVSATERGGKTLYNVRKPTLLSGAGARYLLATEVAIAPGYGRAYDPRLGEPLYAIHGSGTPTYGTSWGPFPGSWVLASTGRGFRAIGNDSGSSALFERVEDNARSSWAQSGSLTLSTSDQYVDCVTPSGNTLNGTWAYFFDTESSTSSVNTNALGRYSVSFQCAIALLETTVTLSLVKVTPSGVFPDYTLTESVVETWTISNADDTHSMTIPVYCRPIQYTPTFIGDANGLFSVSFGHRFKAVKSINGSATLSDGHIIFHAESP